MKQPPAKQLLAKQLPAVLLACLLLLISGCTAANPAALQTLSPAVSTPSVAAPLAAGTPAGEPQTSASSGEASATEDTLLPNSSAVSQGQPAEQASPERACKDSLTFVKDQTIPDGTVIAPESTLDKRWQVENSGDCNWGPAYRVRLIAGPELGAQKEQALYPARGGTQAVIRILFKAPAEAGTYRSAWQAINAQGEPFGDPFFIEIKVEAPQ